METKTIIRASSIQTVFRCPQCKQETPKQEAIKKYDYTKGPTQVCKICKYQGEFEHIEIESITRERPVRPKEDKTFERINCVFDQNAADAQVYLCWDCWDIIEEFRDSEKLHSKTTCKGKTSGNKPCMNTKINPQGFCHWHKNQGLARLEVDGGKRDV